MLTAFVVQFKTDADEVIYIKSAREATKARGSPTEILKKRWGP